MSEESNTFSNIVLAVLAFVLITVGTFSWLPLTLWLVIVGMFGYKMVEAICNLILNRPQRKEEEKKEKKEKEHYLVERWEEWCYEANNWIKTNVVQKFV